MLLEEPGVARMLERIGEFTRLIVMDRRGTGLSDLGDSGPLELEEEAADVVAVLDAVGSERAALMAYTDGGPLVHQVAAALYPERFRALILYAAMARIVAVPGYDWTHTIEEREARFEAADRRTGATGTTSTRWRPAAPATSTCARGSGASSACR